MHPFIHSDFLLRNDTARNLYHHFAASLPIIDYHCHLDPAQIANNHTFGDLSEIWIAGDHYKWRAMRSNGIAERFCTGNASPREKFDAWVSTVPHTLRNPLYHWSHLELARYFGITDLISPATADTIWETANAQLPRLRVHDILNKFQVALIGTTDDPADPLTHHETIRQLNLTGSLKTRVIPTFRPDKAFTVNQPQLFNAWCDKLAATAGLPVNDYDELVLALHRRHDDFAALGCRASDNGLEACPSNPASLETARSIFSAARSGHPASPTEQEAFAARLLLKLGRWNAAKGWTMQLHLGAQRNNNTVAARTLGADTGFDSISDAPQARSLATYLDTLASTGELPRTVLYNLNPSQNYVFATMAGNFQDGSIPGKIQFGAGWWFLDQREGMEWQINALSNLGLLSRFIGMLTDSRSLLSYTRHEYFRRILCQMLGQEMEAGDLPNDLALVGGMVRDICFQNALDYFGFDLDSSFTTPPSRSPEKQTH